MDVRNVNSEMQHDLFCGLSTFQTTRQKHMNQHHIAF